MIQVELKRSLICPLLFHRQVRHSSNMHANTKGKTTTASSTKGELHEIEKSARTMGREASMHLNGNEEPSQRTMGDSSCSSMYLEDDSCYDDSFNDSRDMSWKTSEGPGGERRNSVMMTPAGMLGEVDFDDSDDDSSSPPNGASPVGGADNQNHRPLVGGFAAAAYEAARADHLKRQQAASKKP